MKFYGSLLLCTCLVVFGCAKPEIDEVMLATQFQAAQQAINNAAELEAESLVPEEYGRAMKLLNFARNSQEKADIPQSLEFAYQAEWVAQIAIAQARQRHAKQKVISTREQTYQQIIKAHEHELEIERIRQAITEEQLARALRSRDEEQQEAAQLSSQITDLKTKLRQAELRTPVVNIESLVNIAVAIYPAIKETAAYERTQAAIALVTNLIAQEAFTEAENATAEAQTLVDDLYQLAVQNREAEVAARTNAQIAIAELEIIIQRAQYFDASQHAPKELAEATTQLQRAKSELEANRYEQAHQTAKQAQQIADKAVETAGIAEYRQRAQQELNTLIARAQRAVEGLGERIAKQAETQVPQLEAKLYELANSAHGKAKTALTAKEYQAAIEAAAEGDNYLQRAIANTNQVTSAKSDLLRASKQIPKASTVVERREGVLIRINGNVFAHGSTRVQNEFFDTFAQLAKILRTAEFAGYPVQIEVHTSSLGDTNVNKNLSMGRADSIKRSLIEEGRVDASRVTAKGFGEAKPIVKEGANKEEQNRRVDIIIQTN